MTTGFDYDVCGGHCKTCSVSRGQDLASLWIVWVACGGGGGAGCQEETLPPPPLPSVDHLVLLGVVSLRDFEAD